MSELAKDALFEEDRAFVEFKGALAEQYVLNQLIFECGLKPYYWGNDSGRAEVDFLVQADAHAIPIEVKASTNLRAKSLKLYMEKYNPDIAFRFSLADYHQDGTLINLPLYAISILPELLKAIDEKV